MRNRKVLNTFFSRLIKNEKFIINKIINFIILSAIIFTLVVILRLPSKLNLKVSDKAPKDIVAETEIRYLNNELTKSNEEFIKETFIPIYIYNDIIINDKKNYLNKLLEIIKNSKKYSEINNEFEIEEEDYTNLKKIIRKDKLFIENVLNLFIELYSNTGIVKFDSSHYSKREVPGIKIRKGENEILYSIDRIDSIDNIKNVIPIKIDMIFKNLSEEEKDTVYNILIKNLSPNVYYDKETTEMLLKKKIETESQVFTTIQKGEIIAKKDEQLTTEQIKIINKISENRQKFLSIYEIISIALFVFLILSAYYFIIYFFEQKKFNDFRHFIFVSIILLFVTGYIFCLCYFDLNYKTNIFLGTFFTISAFSIAFLFLYSRLFSAFFAIIVSILIFFITNFNIYAFLFVLLSGLLSVFIIPEIKNRINLVIAGFYISLLNVVISLLIYFNSPDKDLRTLQLLIFSGLVNGLFSSLFAVFIIFISESILNTPTVFRLQELTHFTTPLLKSLFNNAIGTYNHSIIVGNLSESAALEIGANELLAKVGGYYHDIGKLDNPEYFIENQGDYNKHDSLKPSISASIIKAHVKSGVVRAKKARLPQKVIDIIYQHHGNTLIKYFYEEALKTTSPEKEEIFKIDFHYQSTNPEFPEAAIVLLADQVEAATRSLKKYSMSTIEKLIEKIIDDNFQNGILDNSGLTLKDITKIKKVFSKIIVGMYHPRIEYPSSDINLEKNNSKNVKKSAKIG